MARIIDLRAKSGGVEYVGVTITETSGQNITGATVELSLGTSTDPGVWRAPDDDKSPSPSIRTVKLLIGGSYRPPQRSTGYYLWWRLTDSPEVAPRCQRSEKIEIWNDPIS